MSYTLPNNKYRTKRSLYRLLLFAPDVTFLQDPRSLLPVKIETSVFEIVPSLSLDSQADSIPDIMVSTGILHRYRDKIQSIIKGKTQLYQSWIPDGPNVKAWCASDKEFMSNLRIPAVNSKPSLLLHRLGECESQRSLLISQIMDHAHPRDMFVSSWLW